MKAGTKYINRLLRKISNDFRRGDEREFTYYHHNVFYSTATNVDCVDVEIDGKYKFNIDYDLHKVKFDANCPRDVKREVIISLYSEWQMLFPLKYNVKVKMDLSVETIWDFFKDREIRYTSNKVRRVCELVEVGLDIENGERIYRLFIISSHLNVYPIDLKESILKELIRDRICYSDNNDYCLEMDNFALPIRIMENKTLGLNLLQHGGFDSMGGVTRKELEEAFGTDALLVNWEGKFYDVSREPEIYYLANEQKN